MANVVNPAGLSQAAKIYQKDLRLLPYVIMSVEMTKLGIRMLEVPNIDVALKLRRKAGIARPYTPGTVGYSTEIAKFAEVELQVKDCYVSMKDNVKNYQDKTVLNIPAAGTGINQNKKHPLEALIISSIIKSTTEDICDAMFFAQRNPAVLTPLGTMDGFYKKINDAIVSTEIAVAAKNLINTGAIVAPVDETDTDAIDSIIVFIRSANIELKKMPSLLYLTRDVYQFACDALRNKVKYIQGAVDLNYLQTYINTVCMSNVKIIVSDLFGTGDRIILTAPNNFDFGINTMGDYDFVQARFPYEDPNEIQWWLQYSSGTRVIDFDKKMFAINDRTNSSLSLAGDY